MAKSIAFHQRNKNNKPQETVSIDLLSKTLDELELMASAIVRSGEQDSPWGRSDLLNESREGKLAAMPKQFPPGRKPLSRFAQHSLAHQAGENLSCSPSRLTSENSTIVWQVTDQSRANSSPDLQQSSRFLSSRSTLKTATDDNKSCQLDVAREAI